MKKRLLAILLTLCMAAVLLPANAFAATGGAMRPGDGGIAKGDKVYLGRYGEEEVQWIALDDDGFMLSRYTIGSVRFRDCRYYYQTAGPQKPGYYGDDWDHNVEDSQLKLTMDGLYNGEGTTLFTALEQGAVAATDLTAESMDYDGDVRPLTVHLYPLSIMEIYDYSAGEYVIDQALLVTGDITDKINGNEYGWWTRTNDSVTNVVRVGGRDNASPGSDDIRDSMAIRGVRPAFHLDLDKVLFSSAAGGKAASGMAGGLTAVSQTASDEWKLTLLDSDRDFSAAITAYDSENKIAAVAYADAATGTNEYISAIVKDTGGNIKYYGRLKSTAAAADQSGAVDIDLSGVDMAGKTLYIFNEQYNGGTDDDTKLTDCASELVELPLTKNAYSITNSLTGITSNNTSSYRLINDTTMNYIAQFSADAGHTLPAGITVTVNGTPLVAGPTTYEYNSASGILTIYAASITGDIVITETVETYALTVNLNYGIGGTAGGSYAEGANIPIDAGTRANCSFSGWVSSNGGTFLDASSASTTFTMPNNATTITANWISNGGGLGGNDGVYSIVEDALYYDADHDMMNPLPTMTYGDPVYFRLLMPDGSPVVEHAMVANMKINAAFERGSDLIDGEPEIVKLNDFGTYCYFIKLNTVKKLTASDSDVVGTITLNKSKKNKKDAGNYKVKDLKIDIDFTLGYYYNAADNTFEAIIDEPNFPIWPNEFFLCKYDSAADSEVEFEFGSEPNEGTFTVDTSGQGKNLIVFNTDIDENIAAKNPEAAIITLNFNGAKFNRSGVFCYESDTMKYAYEIKNGKLALIGEFSGGEVEFTTNTLGRYVFSDRELVSPERIDDIDFEREFAMTMQ